MREHELKCWPSVFAAVLDGSKTFEFRRNDRDFAVGDVLVLQEFDPGARFPRDYTGESIRVRVTYIAHGGQFEIPIGFCVMSIVTYNGTRRRR